MHLSRAASAFAMVMAAASPHAADAILVARPDEFAIKLYDANEGNSRSRNLHVLDNDSGDPLLIITQAVTSDLSKGVCSIKTTNEGEDVLVWTRNEENLGFVGNTTCSYKVCEGSDAGGNCADNIQVLLKIQPVQAWNDPEEVSGPPIFLEPNQVTRSYNVVANDVPQNEPLRVTSVVKVSGPGTCAIRSDDERFVVFRRVTLDFNASTTMCSYQVCSATGTVYCDSAKVTFTAKELQQTPQFLDANPDRYILPNNQPSSPEGDIKILLNDYSNRPVKLSPQIVSGPAPGAGTCTVVDNRTRIRYTRPARSSFEGEAYCVYRVCTVPRDGEALLCDTSLLTVVVGKPTSRVIPVNDVFVVNPDEGLSPVLPVLANDGTNPPGRPIVVAEIETQSSFGQCIISGDRTGIRYRHEVNVVDFPDSVNCVYIACTTDTLTQACGSATVTIILRTGPTPRPTRNPTRKPVTKNPGKFALRMPQPFPLIYCT